jgi:hypothetical protein
MSDPATNNQNQSYVDSYAPPTLGASPVKQDPTTNKTQTDDSFDAMKKLEELVSEFETTKDEKKSQQLAEIKDLDKDAPAKEEKKAAGDKVDPLAELEKALDEYEKKYKARVEAAKKNPQPALPKSADKVSLEDFEKALSTEEAKADKTVEPKTEDKVEQAVDGEGIEEQNIFDLLGVSDASEEEKESFLDELQQALWEDFLEKDLSLLVSESEMTEIEAIRSKEGMSDEDKQAELIKKIEELVPDIEEVMLEKALELKEDMVMERLAGIRESLGQQSPNIGKLDEAEDHLKNGRWKTGTAILNSL